MLKGSTTISTFECMNVSKDNKNVTRKIPNITSTQSISLHEGHFITFMHTRFTLQTHIGSDELCRVISLLPNASFPPHLSFLNVMLENYSLLNYLDAGAHGQCFVYERLNDSLRTKVVIKRIPCRLSKSQVEEARVLVRCRHPFIIGFYEMFVHDSMFHIVMQYAEGGNMAQLIKERSLQTPKAYFTEERILHYFTQITMALEYLHTQKVIHRDLKPDNVLLNKSMKVVKLADFGISKVIGDDPETRTFIGTSYYVAPEMYNGQPYDRQIDIWALGCVLYELMELEKAFNGPQAALPSKINRAEYARPKQTKNPYLLQILEDCLNVDPNHRPTPNAILCCPPVMIAISKIVTAVDVDY